MKICVGRTGHEIADRVAESLVRGMPDGDYFIGYGILRGMAEEFRKHEHWFNVDRAYFKPGHFDGYYRISYRGTQARYTEDLYHTLCDNRDGDSGVIGSFYSSFGDSYKLYELNPIRKYDKSKPVLICPPTSVVAEFFGQQYWNCNIKNSIWRKKGDMSPIPWDDISAVVTFNSSVGWQAVCRGIPCLSDPLHSVVGSYYSPTGSRKSLDEVIDLFNTRPREPMLDFMRAHQFTLAEIENGKACSLIEHYSATSVGTLEKQSPAKLPPTPSNAGLQNHFQSSI